MESELHRKIVLRQDVVIQGRDQKTTPGLLEDDELVVLKTDKDIVTISPVMREILEVARAPHTPDEMIRWVAQTWGCSYESVYEPICAFLKRMGRLGVLVYEEIKTSTPPVILEELKRKMSFAGFTLLKRLSKNHKVVLYKCSTGEQDSSFYTLKVLLKTNPGESAREKFFKEYKILRSLPKHGNIRNCLQASVCDGIPYLLFDYIEGESMSSKIDKVSLEIKCSIANQLVKAIDHLHAHHILHGDIHASNFLIDQENTLYLIDLGMAYSEYENEMYHGGIPRYMPPERLPDHPIDFSRKKGDYVSEVFQIGTCLYFLFSGNYPFKGVLLKNLANAIKNETPAPLIKTPLGEEIPASIAGVIFKSMAKDPLKRYPSVAEMMHAWESVIRREELIPTRQRARAH